MKVKVRVGARPISIDEAVRAVRRRDCGATCLFLGTVRDRSQGRKVLKLRYTAFGEMAAKELSALAAEVRRRWEIGAVYIAHRTGTLKPGEASVVISVSAPHRTEALEACRFVLERLKDRAPIWKEEFHVRGKTWVGA